MKGEVIFTGDRHTYTHTDIATLWLNRPSGPIQWKKFLVFSILLFSFLSFFNLGPLKHLLKRIHKLNFIYNLIMFWYSFSFHRSNTGKLHCRSYLLLQIWSPMEPFTYKFRPESLQDASSYGLWNAPPHWALALDQIFCLGFALGKSHGRLHIVPRKQYSHTSPWFFHSPIQTCIFDGTSALYVLQLYVLTCLGTNFSNVL